MLRSCSTLGWASHSGSPSFTPQVTPVWHSASLPKQHPALHLHLTVCTPTLHCPDNCTSLSKQLHSTAQTAALHCPDCSPPFVPRYSWQKNNKFHINNIAFVFHKSFHKLQSFFKTSRNPQFT